MRLLQRYILFELLKVFISLLSVLTVLLVFVGVFREASESNLGAAQVLKILPYIIPSLLPFTLPATLLLTVCVVYGRISGDQEVTAAKAAGINVLSLLWPSFFLGAVLSVCSLLLTDQVIPWSMANIQRAIALAMEDIFLDMLRSKHQLIDKDHGFKIVVMAVDGKTLIVPTFEYTPPGGKKTVTLQADEAVMQFDLEKQQVTLHVVRASIVAPGEQDIWIEKGSYSFPLPLQMARPKPRHQTIRRINEDLDELTTELENRRDRRHIETALTLARGNFDHFSHPDFAKHETDIQYGLQDLCKLRTEVHSRFALATSCLFFVFVGGPFAIMQGRRQFLTSFFLCFMPILLIYYPVVLLMMNLSKSGTVDPAYAMWAGNAIVAIVAAIVLRRVLQH